MERKRFHGLQRIFYRDGGPAEASLLFEPTEVLFVHNSALDAEYEEGRDWTLLGRKIVLPEGSRIPSMTNESGAWKGPTPRFAAKELPATIGKLQRNEPVRIVVFGGSIATGYNASGFCWTEWAPARINPSGGT